MFSKRYFKLLVVFSILFIVLITRLFYLQLFEGGKLSKAASIQRIYRAEIEKPRGNILDRNGIPFTNRNNAVFVVLKPMLLKDNDTELLELCNVLNVNYYKIKKELEIKKEPVLIKTEEDKKGLVLDMNLQGVSFINSLKRYDEFSIAKHILGYLNKMDNVGEAGIEKFYEKALIVDITNTVGVITDAKNNVVQGLGYRMSKFDPSIKKLSVKLTLDYHIQKIVESVMEKMDVTGAVIVEDVYSGDVLAMASKPDFEQNSIEDYLLSEKNELYNRAVASYNIGSIFKIIDIAEYFESKKNFGQDEYYCPGYVYIGDKEFKCSSYEIGGHGWIGLKDAFAKSCNSYFIKMGIDLGYNNIIDRAKKFGIGNNTGIGSQGVDESKGKLPDYKKYISDGETANIAIGQGDILASPIQVADMVATVANGGIKNRVNIVDSIIDEDGNKVKGVRIKEGIRIVSKDTSDRIKELMEAVTSEGTGKSAKLEGFGGSGGKTGSAETGQYKGNEKIVQAWFAGYFPKDNPKYSIAVFVENGKSGGEIAAPVFEEIAKEIVKIGY